MRSYIVVIMILTTMAAILTAGVSAITETEVEHCDGGVISGYISGGTTYVPIRELASRCLQGSESVTWDNDTKTARVSFDGGIFEVTASKVEAVHNGSEQMLCGTPTLKESTLYVPLRSVASVFGYTASWDERVRRVSLNVTEGGIRDDLYWLSRIISAESRGEPFEGQLAVGNVVLERVRSEEFPDSVYGVIFDASPTIQFTPVENGTVFDSPSQTCIEAARRCLEGCAVISGCLFFQNPDTTRSSWVSDNRDFVVRIGNHCFYR